jgi:multimeric flavodoxin WrbA
LKEKIDRYGLWARYTLRPKVYADFIQSFIYKKTSMQQINGLFRHREKFFVVRNNNDSFAAVVEIFQNTGYCIAILYFT